MTEPLTLTYISYALGVVAVVEQFLGYLPEGMPRSITQVIVLGGRYLFYKCKKRNSDDEMIVIV